MAVNIKYALGQVPKLGTTWYKLNEKDSDVWKQLVLHEKATSHFTLYYRFLIKVKNLKNRFWRLLENKKMLISTAKIKINNYFL